MPPVRSRTTVLALWLALLVPTVALADDPKWDYGKLEAVKEVVWKASASAGAVLTTGNSNTLTISGGLMVSRNDGKNKLQLDASGAYAKSSVRVGNDKDGDGQINSADEISTIDKVTAQTWAVKLRYDRFFTENNSAYVAAQVASDVPAGKDIFGGGQAGYARQVVKTQMHLLSAEIGYDYSFIGYTGKDSASLHSARAFLGYTLSLTADTALSAQAEALFNLNPLDLPAGHASPFQDVRVNGKAVLTTKLWRNLSFRFSFTAHFDNYPGPLPALNLPFGPSHAVGATAPMGAPSFTPIAQKLDTLTEAALIVDFI